VGLGQSIKALFFLLLLQQALLGFLLDLQSCSAAAKDWAKDSIWVETQSIAFLQAESVYRQFQALLCEVFCICRASWLLRSLSWACSVRCGDKVCRSFQFGD